MSRWLADFLVWFPPTRWVLMLLYAYLHINNEPIPREPSAPAPPAPPEPSQE